MGCAFQEEIISFLGISKENHSPLTEEEIQTLYATAYDLYSRENYREAAQLFTRLVLADPFSEGFWRGLAGSKQMGGDPEGALHAWAMVSLLNDQDPTPHFHAAQCSFNANEPTDGLKALETASQLCEANSLLEKQIEQLKKSTSCLQ